MSQGACLPVSLLFTANVWPVAELRQQDSQLEILYFLSFNCYMIYLFCMTDCISIRRGTSCQNLFLIVLICSINYRPWSVLLHHGNAERTERNALGTERNLLGTKGNASRTERFAFLGTERVVHFGLVFNFTRYSDFLAWRIGLLFIFATQNWE